VKSSHKSNIYPSPNSVGVINDLFPVIHVYPSLQAQRKSISYISYLSDLFPEHSNIKHELAEIFHLIPWDLPYINLGRIDTHLNGLFQEIKILILGDISSLLTHPTLLNQYIRKIRSWASPSTMLYAPGVPSSYIPILVYLGIDLFDFLYLEMISTKFEDNFDSILDQSFSIQYFDRRLMESREAIKIGKLRDLIRVYANSFPPMKTLLRIIDKDITLTENTSSYSRKLLFCTDETDFTRPEVSRFRKRVQTRYLPPSHHKGILFLPCSAKKPYSKSRSHTLFKSITHRNLKKRRHLIGEVILTSPLGVVPRDLEYTYPAAHYDIPVTGNWLEIEKTHLKKDLSAFIQKIDPDIPLMGYIGGIERKILKEVCEKYSRTINLISEESSTSLTSRASLQEFALLLRTIFKEISYNKKVSSQLSFLRIIADFQFGKGTGSILFPNDVRISGYKELGLRVKHNNKHLVTFRPNIGLLTLSLEAGKRILGHTRNTVIFDGDSISGSTIFAKGIIKADPSISPFEEVLILNSEGNLLATGTTYLSGNNLVEMKRGKGIKIRKKVK
ncbi:MAG: DUF5591 domain-containing protein, partial [Candidatus Hodarchaeales archaeon]